MAEDTSLRVESLSEEPDHDDDEALATRSDEVTKTNDEIKKGGKMKAKRHGGKGLLSYFSSEGCGSSNMGKENGPKRRKVQVNKYFCIYENCDKIIARGK